MGNQTKFVSYDGLALSLGRGKVKSPYTAATLLLETFIANNGQLSAGIVVERGLCEEGKFTEWRKELIDKGWINYSVGDYSRHSPGAKLMKYINKEKMQNEEIASMRDVRFEVAEAKKEMATKLELAEVKQEVAYIRKAMEELIEEVDPPATKSKIDARIERVKSKKNPR